MTVDAGGGRIFTLYSYKGGTGRSMALANIAWILASNGKRVLAVDWDLEAPGLHRYFHPFLPDKESSSTPGLMDMLWNYASAVVDSGQSRHDGWREAYADVLEHVVSLRQPFPGDGVVDLLTAGQQDRSYASRVSSFDWGNFYDRLHGGSFIEEMKRSMRRHYDYVLIDSRTGLNDASGICTVQLPDTLVICFTLSSQSVNGALAVADSALRQRRADDLRVLPVPMRVEDGETSRLEAGRSYVRSGFRRFLRGYDHEQRDRYWGDVEIPYKVFYAYEEILATVGDRPRQEGSLLAAYERLTAHLTEGQVQELVPLDDIDREVLIKRFWRPAARRGLYDFYISHVPSDQQWAEWIAAHLERAGYRVWLNRWEVRPGSRWPDEIEKAILASDAVLALLSPAAVRSTAVQQEWRLARDVDPGGESGRLVPVEVVECVVPHALRDLQGVRLAGEYEPAARQRLLTAAQQIQAPSGGHLYHRDHRPPARFPGQPPDVSNLPSRPRPFIGRDEEIYALWSGFHHSNARSQAICGLAGIGKTATALEFAHRYAHEYEVVWWMRATRPEDAVDGLAHLAAALGLPATGAADSGALRSELRRQRRVLLVFDDAEALPEAVPTLPETVDVLLTSRLRDWEAGVAEHHLHPLSTDAAQALLRAMHHTLLEREAQKLLDWSAGLPLALVTGAASLDLTNSIWQDSRKGLRRDDETGHSQLLAPFWSWARNRLETESPAAAELIQVLAFFAPRPVPFRVFTDTPAAVNDPGLRKALAVPSAFAAVLSTLHRHHLAELADDHLLVHPLLQAAVQDDLTPAAEKSLRGQVERLLVSAPLGDASDPANWPRYAELLPHVLASDWAQGPALRALVLRLPGYLMASGSVRPARQLATTIVDRFTTLLGQEQVATADALHVLAAVTWEDGDDEAALALTQRLRDLRRRLLGEDHPDTLATMNNLAVLLWSKGDHEHALAVSEELLQRRQTLLGPDHPHTIVALGNRATILYALGRYDEAADCEQRVYASRRETLGERHPVTLASLGNLAALQASRGHPDEASAMYERLVAAYRAALGADHPNTLRAQFHLSRAMIRAGNLTDGRKLLEATLDQQRRCLGNHPDMVASQSLLAELAESW
ncbi:hypothetical protein DLJ47_28255 [Micromonospora sp. S4605]|uniref:FxSxx-COOH system tetratricopeptide repeat protein n=1 Tax=Micromonospora sp. S4605 TaxID=1420897 RepID=UPI000D6FFA73|nr:FxSxx-COOH system tetratricopeptide repeat protein [Micromonospora sp. S4605]PWU48500.1 hypothetical protein DLJ47_28255 [Micromonospora sp. S4605]